MSTIIVNNIVGKDSGPVTFPNGLRIASGSTGGINDIGVAGNVGFGVGIHPGPLPTGFAEMTGTTNPASDNYGNYQYIDGSIMVWVPAFYYKYGTGANGFDVNVVDIKPFSAYKDVATANAAGYALHRAFYNAGAVQPGFFLDKYIASKNAANTSCVSVKNGTPISLTTDANYTNSNGMVTSEGTCVGQLHDAITLSRSRGAGRFQCATIFMYNAMALLSLAHGQAATSSTYCAWYDAAGTTNFPKGCNNNALGDTNDASILYVSAGDAGVSAKPLTGSANLFSRTTHNGQNCGIADLNGSMWQTLIGVTNPGTSATGGTQITTDGNAYVLKTTVDIATLTAGWNTATDVWQDSTNIGTLYDAVTGLFPWGTSHSDWVRFGNGANQVFDEATSGDGWRRTACGIQRNNDGASTGGTNLFGVDGCYRYNRANLFALGSGSWLGASYAGVFARLWNTYRTSAGSGNGFRACCFGI